MTLQVLIATMNQTDHGLLKRMNIQSDAIVINQCDRYEIEQFRFRGHDILWMSMKERGVGLSRNTALMRATADIVLFADEDVTYADGYPEMILNRFARNPMADILLVDLKAVGNVEKSKKAYTDHRVRWYNSMQYGAVHFACRREKLFKKGISFNLQFGGGALYSCGEDSIFLSDALKASLRVWTVSGYIGKVTYGNSTWFMGYTDKYFYDKGVLMGTIFGRKAYLLTVALFLKNRHQVKDCGFVSAIQKAFAGIRQT